MSGIDAATTIAVGRALAASRSPSSPRAATGGREAGLGEGRAELLAEPVVAVDHEHEVARGRRAEPVADPREHAPDVVRLADVVVRTDAQLARRGP